ncbi:hypothetical protein [Desulfolutivibrio sulfoxidireducens]|uniref:hypothetical protein n=1 Tax=Desulfolutivibrio sulfoxidireducens TaxID=2773299 RepID=UPI00159E366A|nr:hypothetical protein [Desulfolutivibrio sulfoxidireducens]QLA17462.1 hypothetical protein GD605_15920 [Desulfolutivibrio sulfoxidireducens]QLA21049.1 hypothetical protein GD604_15625 [Desulfolutivibrio sulfoxidireducens]
MSVAARFSGMRRVFSALAIMAVLASGCAELTARHLDSRNWNPAAEQTLTMRHWRFAFASVPTRESYGVKGAATVLADTLPSWVDRVQELTLTAYLRDAAGTVLATDHKTYLPMNLSDAANVSFDFFLAPASNRPDTSLSVSFGYRAVFTSSSAARAAAGGKLPAQFVFFAGEAALVRE